MAKNQGISSLFKHCESSQELIDVSKCYQEVCKETSDKETSALHAQLYLVGYSMELAIKSKAYWVYKEYKKPREKIDESTIKEVLNCVVFEEGVTQAIKKKHGTNYDQYIRDNQEYDKNDQKKVNEEIKKDIEVIAKKIIERGKKREHEKRSISKTETILSDPCSLENLLKHINGYIPYETNDTKTRDVKQKVTRGMLSSAMEKLKDTNFSTQGNRHNIANLWEALGKLLKVWNEPHQQEMENQILSRDKSREKSINSSETKTGKGYRDQERDSSAKSTKSQNEKKKESGWESLRNKIQSLSWNEQVRYKKMTGSKQDAKNELSKAISLSEELLEACKIVESKEP